MKLGAKIMQTSAMKACFQIAEYSLSAAKIPKISLIPKIILIFWIVILKLILIFGIRQMYDLVLFVFPYILMPHGRGIILKLI